MTLRFIDVVPRVPVRDLTTVTQFYVHIFGFAVDTVWPDDAPTFAMLSRDSAELQFYRTTRDQQCGGVMLNVQVSDANAVHASLAGRVVVEWGPEDYWYGRREFAVRDPEGNLVIVTAKLAGGS